MTLLPMPTVIVIGLDAADGPPRNPAQQVVVPINLAERSRFSLLHRQPSSSPDAVLNRRRHRRTNGALFAAAKPASTSIAATPEPLSP